MNSREWRESITGLRLRQREKEISNEKMKSIGLGSPGKENKREEKLNEHLKLHVDFLSTFLNSELKKVTTDMYKGDIKC